MRTIAICALLGVAGAVYAADAAPQRKVYSNPYDVHNIVRPFDPAPAGVSVAGDWRPRSVAKVQRKAGTLTTYNSVFESYHENYMFSIDGGEFVNYNVDVTIDGNSATISNLFNFNAAPDGYCTEVEINGVYDEATHTITIPTSRQLDQATRVGEFYGSLPIVLMTGTVAADETILPADNLVFKLSNDGKTLSTQQDFGAMIYTVDGKPYMMKTLYMGGVMHAEGAKSEMVCFATDIDFGNVYTNQTSNRYVRMYNFGDAAMIANISCKSSQFVPRMPQANIEPMDYTEVEVGYKPDAVGAHTGNLVLNAMGRTKVVPMKGNAVEAPDYSYLVKGGEMTFLTGANNPFLRYEADGKVAARSNNAKTNGNVSYLTAVFDVPEGQLATFNWTAYTSSTVDYGGVPEVYADGELVREYKNLYKTTLQDSVKFAPGRHELKFAYTVRYTDYYYPEDDYMYVCDLELTGRPMADDAVVCVEGRCTFDAAICQEGTIERTAVITLRNEGRNELKVTGVTASQHFNGKVPSYAKAETLGTVMLPVTFRTDQVGQFDETIVVHTSAGDLPVDCSILVRPMPDFQSIVKEGQFNFSTTEAHPFLVENGVAYNSTAKVPDTKVTFCRMTAEFTVPKGKVGVLSWKGRLSTSPLDNITDYLSISIYGPGNASQTLIPGEYDLDSSKFPYYEAPDGKWLNIPSGEGSISFTYVQFGDSQYFGDDRVEVRELALTLYDAQENAADLLTPTLEFPDVYVGRSQVLMAKFKNTGMEPLVVLDGYGSDNFLPVATSVAAPFQSTLEVPVYFTPGEAGRWEEDVVIETSAGEFTVHCTGTALSMDNILLLQDFDKFDEVDWQAYDRDGDGDCWDFAFNAFGGYTMGHVHSGEDCIVSFSRDRFRVYTPDNWTFTPAFTVPANGAKLSWWTAADYGDPTPLGDRYTLYIAEGVCFENGTLGLENYHALYTEELSSTEWQQHNLDLSEYAGKNVHLAFRHHDCTGKYMLKLDDVRVDVPTENAVGSVTADAKPVKVEYFSVDGRRLSAPAQQGVTLVRTTFDNGSVISKKEVRR